MSLRAYESLLPYVHRAAIGKIFVLSFYEQLFAGTLNLLRTTRVNNMIII